jgi:hypothetical protein
MLQRRLSNGNWHDVSPENESYFIEQAIKFDQRYPDTFRGKLGLQTEQDVITALCAGKSLQYSTDWYAQIRDGETFEAARAAQVAKRKNDPNYSEQGWELDCGCIVHHRTHIMNSSSGSSCTDCYDRMSD